ncbi:MAG: hydroxymethylglutaryl-CoA lyase [Thermaerobacter sp.]|nr:hydroxymethylglutaryl-CoA lyase [Thermaerobacter sp.]
MNIWELPEEVAIREVGARDFRRLAMDDRVAVIDALTMAGFERIEAGSLVPVGGMPEDDAVGEVMARIERKPGMTYSVMVSNPEQAERALTMDPDELTLLMSASESHNRWMTGRGMAESLVGFSKICDLARDQAVTVSALITASFGCSYEGRVPRSVVIDLASRMDNMGIARVTLSDTVGAANPAQVAEMVRTVRMTVPMVHLGLHFQNRRGTALANLVVAVLAGATRFDTAVGGVPGASLTETPGAQGASEEVVYCLREMGINTGVDMTKLLEAARMLAAQLPGGLASKVT